MKVRKMSLKKYLKGRANAHGKAGKQALYAFALR